MISSQKCTEVRALMMAYQARRCKMKYKGFEEGVEEQTKKLDDNDNCMINL